MTKCDWRGPICMTNKDADRMVGADITLADGTQLHCGPDDEISFDPEGYMVNGERIGWPRVLSPIIEPGDEITVRKGCSRRDGHRGRHGHGPIRRLHLWARRVLAAAISRR